MLYSRIVVLLVSLIIGLTGCNSPVYNQTEANVADVTQRVADAKMKMENDIKAPPPLVVNQGMYVDRSPISLQREPRWLKNHIIFRGDQLPFSYYSRNIATGGGKDILTHYQVGLDQTQVVNLNYSGTVKGALDLLAAKTGYVYTINGRSVYWQAFVTKSFDVAFMPGSSDYMMGKAGGGSGPTTSSGGGGAAGGSGSSSVVQGTLDNTADAEYSNLKGTLSVWADLKAGIEQLLSKDGKVVVSQSTTSVTVRDRPSNVNLISQYISNLNNRLSRQVLVKVEILDVTLGNAFNFGIDWSAVKRSFGHEFQLNGNYGTPVSITPLTPTAGTPSLLPQFGINNFRGLGTGVTALASALTQQGKVALVTQPRVVCLNNQVSVIRITSQEGYLASVSTTAFGGSNGSNTTNIQQNQVTSTVTPGSVITGLTLYILPKIMKNKIYLQVNADLSTLDGIKTISSQGTGDPATAATNAPLIQVPNVTFKQFNQRAVIASGDTLILSGFKQVTNDVGAMQLFDSQALGGKGANQINKETIVLITPIILPGSA